MSIQQARMKIFYIVLGIGLTFLAFYRAATLSMTHDESASVFGLIDTPIWSHLFRSDVWGTANNHWLNTLLFKLFSSIFGVKEWALRLGSVLAFPLFIYALYTIYKKLNTNIYSQFIGLGLLVTNAIVFDYFSLARGYGLSISFLMLGFIFILNYLEKEENKFLIYFVLALLASSLSLFSNVIFYAVLSAALVVVLWRSGRFKVKPIATLAVGGIGIGLFTFIPLKTLSTANEFLWGADSLHQSFTSLCFQFIHHQKYLSNPEILLGVLGTCMIIALIVILVDFVKYEKKGNARFLSFLALGFVLFILSMWLSNLILGAKYPVERKCIIYFPFIALILSLYVDQFVTTGYRKWLGIILGIFFTFHFLKSTRIDSVWEWWYDAHTKKITALIVEDAGTKPVTVGMHWMFYPTLNHYNYFTLKDQFQLGDYSKSLILDVPYDYYVLFKGDFPAIADNYEIIYEANNSQVLARRKKINSGE